MFMLISMYFYVFCTSTSEKALTGSVNHEHGTWNDICLQMTEIYLFTDVASVEAFSALKVLSLY